MHWQRYPFHGPTRTLKRCLNQGLQCNRGPFRYLKNAEHKGSKAKGKAAATGTPATGAANPPEAPSPSKTPSTLTAAQKLKGGILQECSSVERMLLTVEASNEGDEWNHLNNDQNFGGPLGRGRTLINSS